MDGDWTEVKAKPKKSKPQNQNQGGTQYGGKGAGGKLIAGPIKNGQMAGGGNKASLNNQATTIAEFDYHIDDERYEEVKIELVSHTCAQAVSEARTHANLT